MSTERFEFAFAPSYTRIASAFGVKPVTASIEVDEATFDARFGRWRVRTPLFNIADAEVTGPYRFFKTAGPARLAVTDRGLTFATNGRRGVRLAFKESVPGLDPFGLIRHPELTVTVADVDRLVAVLKRS
jgi:hypothetical protein